MEAVGSEVVNLAVVGFEAVGSEVVNLTVVSSE